MRCDVPHEKIGDIITGIAGEILNQMKRINQKHLIICGKCPS